MFTPTSNPYSFKYLITAISGDGGIKQVYLPPCPSKDKILFKKEQKFVRPEMPEALRKEVNKWRKNPDYRSHLYKEIKEWEDTEWERSTNGIWFWNNGVATYLTGFYYWYISCWQTYFGYPVYRESDKEITYWIQFWEEDPDAYGGILNTIRRYGKSSIMGGWSVYRATRNYNHYCGIQGEKDDKAEKFYNQMILKPFKKLPYYYKPTYDTSTLQKSEIKFERASVRGKKALDDLDENDESLESVIDYRPSGEAEYDGSVLNSYICEEPGKTLTCNIYERWKIVKPCLRKGRQLRGKCFMGTTVEFLDVTDRGGKAYKKLFFDSDYDDRGPDNRTKSGLYASFLPGDTAYEDFLDEWGHPMREESKRSILLEREGVKDNPKDLSDLIRKYPIYLKEIFYINTDKCIYNATILQNRLSDINMSSEPMTSKVDFLWENNVRFSKVIRRHNPLNGWAQVGWLPEKSEDANLVETKSIGGRTIYLPLNESKFAAGVDPVDHGIVIEGKKNGDDESVSTRRSRPVLFVKRKYDSSIDGTLTQEILEQRAIDKYPYKTNRHILMMDTRPNDPNVFYERALMICWYFGCSIQVEDQKPGIKNWFHAANCEAFLQQKYIAESNVKKINIYAEGTPASSISINEYVEARATDIEYFGHLILFRELLEDELVFNPKKTTQSDYAVAAGWTELACKTQPKNAPKKPVNLMDYMTMFDPYTQEVIN